MVFKPNPSFKITQREEEFCRCFNYMRWKKAGLQTENIKSPPKIGRIPSLKRDSTGQVAVNQLMPG
jgi:hypothetical protein